MSNLELFRKSVKFFFVDPTALNSNKFYQSIYLNNLIESLITLRIVISILRNTRNYLKIHNFDDLQQGRFF